MKFCDLHVSCGHRPNLNSLIVLLSIGVRLALSEQLKQGFLVGQSPGNLKDWGLTFAT